MQKYLEKAEMLVQALPYIQKFNGKTIVVKYGGNAMIDEDLKHSVIQDIVLLSYVGINIVVVHGGGPEITEMLKKIQKESRFINGLRYTDQETMDIVQQVLCGKVNKNLVGMINRVGGKALGLCGIDAGMIGATKLKSGDADYGLVGEIQRIDPNLVNDALEKGYIPVVSTVAYGMDRHGSYNVNADTAAAKLAAELGALKLVLLTDIAGLLTDPKDDTTLIHVVEKEEISGLIENGIVSGGMIPKVKCCEEALNGGVKRAHIIDGRVPHSMLVELLSDKGIGTMFYKKKEE